MCNQQLKSHLLASCTLVSWIRPAKATSKLYLPRTLRIRMNNSKIIYYMEYHNVQEMYLSQGFIAVETVQTQKTVTKRIQFLHTLYQSQLCH